MIQYQYRVNINFIEWGCPYQIDIKESKWYSWYLVKDVKYDSDICCDVITLISTEGRFIKITALDIYEKRVEFIKSPYYDDMTDMLNMIVHKLEMK